MEPTYGKRVLGAVRQSKSKDNSVSPEQQRGRITQYAQDDGRTLVKITTDVNVSGKTNPFTRKGLGPWLTDPELVASWDLLVATKLDRVARSVKEYLGLVEWAFKNDKRIVLLDDPDLDMSTPTGEAMGTMRAVFARLEWRMIQQRRAETLAQLRQEGRWSGGPVPFGWRAVRRTGTEEDEDGKPRPVKGWELVPDDGGTAEVLREMAAMSRDGKSNGQIQRWLNGHAHPPWSLAYLNAAGKAWSVERVRIVLHAEATARLLDLDTDGTSAELRAALKARTPVNRGERVGGHLLLRVAFCAACGRPLYYQKKRLTRTVSYYKCLKCFVYVNADWLESVVESVLLENAGGWKLTRRRLVPGDAAQATIAQLRAEVKALAAITGTEAVIAAKEAEIATLEAQELQPDNWVTEETGETVAQRWAALGCDEERGSFLRSLGITARASKTTVEMGQEGGPWAEGWVPVLGLLPPRDSLTGKSGPVMWTVAKAA